jgi:hypothetical protein
MSGFPYSHGSTENSNQYQHVPNPNNNEQSNNNNHTDQYTIQSKSDQ